MTDYKIGDKVRIVNDYETWSEGEFPENSILTVVEMSECDDTINRKNLTIELEALEDYPSDFELVKDAPFGGFHNGAVLNLPNDIERTLLEGYKEAIIKSHESRDTNTLGVYRPNLEDRKVGKVRVELVDDGFPLALREIAKVMTWAQTAKGYKDHDWQNLPNPEQGLAGATSRHRTDHVIQRMVDTKPAIECTDHESNILHKAHEAFGVLAQLELILRGVIK